ncbi:MAG: PspC domain-containing protein [bacterium]
MSDQAPIKQLYRSTKNRMLFGVCGGLGEYFGLDPIIFRIIFVVLVFCAGSGVLLYLALALIMPKQPIADAPAAGFMEGPIDFKARLNDLAAEARQYGSVSASRNWIAGVIIFIGVMIILGEILPRGFFFGGFLWGAIIIVIGLYVLSRRSHPTEYLPPKPGL